MKKIKGPAIFLAQFVGEEAPFNSLDNILQNYDRFMKKANLGRDHILQNFSWSVIANSYIEHISSTLTSHPTVNNDSKRPDARLLESIEVSENGKHQEHHLGMPIRFCCTETPLGL